MRRMIALFLLLSVLFHYGQEVLLSFYGVKSSDIWK